MYWHLSCTKLDRKSERDKTETFVTIELEQLKWIILSLNKHPSIVNKSLPDDVTMAPRKDKKVQKNLSSNRQPDATSSWHNNPWPGAGGIWIKDLNRLILSPLGDQLSILNAIPKKRFWRKVSQADWFRDSHVSAPCLSHCNKGSFTLYDFSGCDCDLFLLVEVGSHVQHLLW